MGESQNHIHLVKIARKYILSLIPAGNTKLLCADLPDEIEKPLSIYGKFKPDLYYSFNNLLIIGEAKTLNDFERTHSVEQFDSYIKYCNNFEGTSILVISVPWQLHKTAKNYFCRKKRKEVLNIKFIILNELGMIEEI